MRPIHMAIKAGFLEKIELLIERGGTDQLRAVDPKGLSLLEHAARCCYWEKREKIFKLILIPRIEENDFTENEATALVAAHFRDYFPTSEAIDIIWAFVNHGMSPSLFGKGFQEHLRNRATLYRRKSARK